MTAHQGTKVFSQILQELCYKINKKKLTYKKDQLLTQSKKPQKQQCKPQNCQWCQCIFTNLTIN